MEMKCDMEDTPLHDEIRQPLASACFEEHRIVHPARAPDNANKKYDDELRRIEQDEGILELSISPAKGIVTGCCPTSRQDAHEANTTKYLWVVAKINMPVALEHPANGTTLARGRLAHTNLTGGEDAHTAGELWFCDEGTIVINGGSSRYKPRSSEELMSMARSFKAAGYKVANMGWDETGPVRFLRGQPEWL